MYDVWFVGDNFLEQNYTALQVLKATNIVWKKELPYLYDYYNVYGYCQKATTGVRRVIARTLNSVISGLNNRPQLPRFLIIMLDKDLLKDINIHENEEWEDIAKENLKWLTGQIDMHIRCKRLELLDKRPGAVYASDPKIIYVKMLRRPDTFTQESQLDVLFSARSKFNKFLCSAVANVEHHILGIESCSDSTVNFDAFGNLNTRGKWVFWQEMNELMEKFDKKKITLLPRVNKGGKAKQNRSDKPKNWH